MSAQQEPKLDMKTATQLDLEQELRAGRDVMLELERRTSNKSGVSALSEGNATGEMDLLAETERLLAKMNNLSNLNSTALASQSCDPPSTFANNNNNSNNNKSEGIGLSLSNDAEDDEALNEILAKAEQLSSLMQSISENISLHEGNTNTSDIQKNDIKTRSSPQAGSTPSTDENSSYAGRRSLKQDPPGSVQENSNNPNNKTPSPASSIQRPTSAVHLPLSMMDDDVSSVGSASFRPYPRTESKSSRHFSPNLNDTPENTHTPQRADSLLGVMPPKMERTGNTVSPDDSEQAPSEPVCYKIPPTDLRADFDVMEASSRRDASEGAVQWEKVTTAAPGEDDYVPLVDYSHVRPSAGYASNNNVESRLERHRRRSQARRKRRIRIAAAVFPVVAAAAVYYMYVREPACVEPDAAPAEEKMEPLFQSYDTSLLQDEGAEGFSFEGEDPSVLVTLPKIIPSRMEQEAKEKPKRRGLFGRLKKA